MGINRLFLGAFNTKILGEEIKVKKDKTFDEILHEEHAKLMQLISRIEKKRTAEPLCRKHNLKTEYFPPSHE